MKLALWRVAAWKETAFDQYSVRSVILERPREGHRQIDEHWNCFDSNTGNVLRHRVERIINGDIYHLELNCSSCIAVSQTFLFLIGLRVPLKPTCSP